MAIQRPKDRSGTAFLCVSYIARVVAPIPDSPFSESFENTSSTHFVNEGKRRARVSALALGVQPKPDTRTHWSLTDPSERRSGQQTKLDMMEIVLGFASLPWVHGW